MARLKASTTVYVGNLAFHTTEEQIHELFGKCGLLRRIVMGLDKNARTPCGFCFVEYHTRADTESCVRYLNGVLLDERSVRIDFDWCAPPRCCACRRWRSSGRARARGARAPRGDEGWLSHPPAALLRGFQEGRQFGRGKHGGQVRDEYRTTFDVGRGGYGKLVGEGLSSKGLAGAEPSPPVARAGAKREREEVGGGRRRSGGRRRAERTPASSGAGGRRTSEAAGLVYEASLTR